MKIRNRKTHSQVCIATLEIRFSHNWDVFLSELPQIHCRMMFFLFTSSPFPSVSPQSALQSVSASSVGNQWQQRQLQKFKINPFLRCIHFAYCNKFCLLGDIKFKFCPAHCAIKSMYLWSPCACDHFVWILASQTRSCYRKSRSWTWEYNGLASSVSIVPRNVYLWS